MLTQVSKQHRRLKYTNVWLVRSSSIFYTRILWIDWCTSVSRSRGSTEILLFSINHWGSFRPRPGLVVPLLNLAFHVNYVSILLLMHLHCYSNLQNTSYIQLQPLLCMSANLLPGCCTCCGWRSLVPHTINCCIKPSHTVSIHVFFCILTNILSAWCRILQRRMLISKEISALIGYFCIHT